MIYQILKEMLNLNENRKARKNIQGDFSFTILGHIPLF